MGDRVEQEQAIAAELAIPHLVPLLILALDGDIPFLYLHIVLLTFIFEKWQTWLGWLLQFFICLNLEVGLSVEVASLEILQLLSFGCAASCMVERPHPQ